MKMISLKIIKILVLITWFVHVAFILYRNVYPDVPSMKVYTKSLKDMEFPICFKICVNEKGKDRFLELGYKYDQRLFRGESKYNSSVLGWLGHKRNGIRLKSIEGT